MSFKVVILGAGLAGSEAALQLANRSVHVKLVEMRPCSTTPVHTSDSCAELVCSNSFKSMKTESAAGMLKTELDLLGSELMDVARHNAVDAGGALAVNRLAFAREVTRRIKQHPFIQLVREEARSVASYACSADAVIVATGPLTSNDLAADLRKITGLEGLSFYDAAAPIVMAESLDDAYLFRQSRYEQDKPGEGDYLNAPFSRQEYDHFIHELVMAERVILRDFESHELFQACQPIEEIARKGHDAPRFGPLKPVGLINPHTDCRPWAALQLRAEDRSGSCYNLVGFQTNLTFSEQKRVFRLIPGLNRAEFARFGVMHRNTFLNAPRILDEYLRVKTPEVQAMASPLYVAGQLAGTEGYTEAVRSGVHVAFSVLADLQHKELPTLSRASVFGALLAYATDEKTQNYQPMHVNFGIIEPLAIPFRNKRERYRAYAKRGFEELKRYRACLVKEDFLGDDPHGDHLVEKLEKFVDVPENRVTINNSEERKRLGSCGA